MTCVTDRLRRLEERLRDWEPTHEDVQAAWGWMGERAKAKFRGESADEVRRARERDTIERWARLEGVNWRPRPSARRRS
ncbi:MAG: hypothetical protein M3317_12545 [Actinomycetota bacterium]|nr:hypothetical protein [Actinomycetota bacterium]